MTNKNEKAKIQAYIKDTVYPVFKDVKNTYEIDYGKALDINLFKADDLSEVIITLGDSQVDYKKAGKYEAIVTDEDQYGNTVEKEFTDLCLCS